MGLLVSLWLEDRAESRSPDRRCYRLAILVVVWVVEVLWGTQDVFHGDNGAGGHRCARKPEDEERGRIRRFYVSRLSTKKM